MASEHTFRASMALTISAESGCGSARCMDAQHLALLPYTTWVLEAG